MNRTSLHLSLACTTLAVLTTATPSRAQCESKLVDASGGSADDNFGYSCSLAGTLMAVGAPYDESPATDGGSVSIFERVGFNTWALQKKIPRNFGNANMGASVALSGDHLLAGAPHDGANAGKAHLFRRDLGGTNNWGQVKQLVDSGGGSADTFGESVDLDGNNALVGSPGESNGSLTHAGGVFLFERDSGGTDNWGQTKHVVPSDPGAFDNFGRSVGIFGDTMVVGAPYDDTAGNGSDAGSAYIFQRDVGGTNNWGQVKKLTADTSLFGDWFGFAVAIHGDTVLIGAPNRGPGFVNGLLFLFERNQGGTDNWGLVKTLYAGCNNGHLGNSVALSADFAVGGQPSGCNANGTSTGAARVFRRNQGGTNNWGLYKNLTADDGVFDDQFGWSVAADGTWVGAGAAWKSDFGSRSGAAYAYPMTKCTILPH